MLETHPPDAIIVHGHFLAQVLEMLMDNHETRNHTIIVLGQYTLPTDLAHRLKIFDWAQLEADCAKAEKVEAMSIRQC